MSQQPDQHLIDATINGDTKSFEVLVDRYKYMVYSLAMKILRNREEAEEVSQDVFLKVYRGLSTFKGDSKFSTWIYRITYNRSLDYVSKKGRRLQVDSIDSEREYNLSSVETIFDLLEAQEKRATIKDAIADLSEDDAVVITLHYFEELSLKEIADIMGIQANNVKVRLFRSRKRLAQILQGKLEQETIKHYGR